MPFGVFSKHRKYSSWAEPSTSTRDSSLLSFFKYPSTVHANVPKQSVSGRGSGKRPDQRRQQMPRGTVYSHRASSSPASRSSRHSLTPHMEKSALRPSSSNYPNRSFQRQLPPSLLDDPAFSSDPHANPHFSSYSVFSQMTSAEIMAKPPTPPDINPPPPYTSSPTRTAELDDLESFRLLHPPRTPYPSPNDERNSTTSLPYLSSPAPSLYASSSSTCSHMSTTASPPTPPPQSIPSTPSLPPQPDFTPDVKQLIRLSPPTDSHMPTPAPSQPLRLENTPRPAVSRIATAPNPQIADRPDLPVRATTTVPGPRSEDITAPPLASRLTNRSRRLPMAVELDSIDELDETDPLGLPWHHEGPYQAIRKITQREKRERQLRQAEIDSQRHLQGQMNPLDIQHAINSGMSLNLKPGDILPSRPVVLSPPIQPYREPSYEQRPAEVLDEIHYTSPAPHQHQGAMHPYDQVRQTPESRQPQTAPQPQRGHRHNHLHKPPSSHSRRRPHPTDFDPYAEIALQQQEALNYANVNQGQAITRRETVQGPPQGLRGSPTRVSPPSVLQRQWSEECDYRSPPEASQYTVPYAQYPHPINAQQQQLLGPNHPVNVQPYAPDSRFPPASMSQNGAAYTRYAASAPQLSSRDNIPPPLVRRVTYENPQDGMHARNPQYAITSIPSVNGPHRAPGGDYRSTPMPNGLDEHDIAREQHFQSRHEQFGSDVPEGSRQNQGGSAGYVTQNGMLAPPPPAGPMPAAYQRQPSDGRSVTTGSSQNSGSYASSSSSNTRRQLPPSHVPKRLVMPMPLQQSLHLPPQQQQLREQSPRAEENISHSMQTSQVRFKAPEAPYEAYVATSSTGQLPKARDIPMTDGQGRKLVRKRMSTPPTASMHSHSRSHSHSTPPHTPSSASQVPAIFHAPPPTDSKDVYRQAKNEKQKQIQEKQEKHEKPAKIPKRVLSKRRNDL